MEDISEALQTESAEAHLDSGQTGDLLGVGGCRTEDGPTGHILTDDVHRSDVEAADESEQVFSGDRTAVIVVGDVGVPESAKIDCEHTMTLGEQRDELVKGPPGLGETMNEKHGRSGVPR